MSAKKNRPIQFQARQQRCRRVRTLASASGIAAGAFLTWAAAAKALDAPPVIPPPAGAPLAAKWEYSRDGGKTFSADVPVIPVSGGPDATNAYLVRAAFTLDDPAGIGGVKVVAGTNSGAFALTSADSVQRRYVGSAPNLVDLKLTVNDKETDAGLFPCRLYNWLTLDPALLRKGENRLTLAGVFWSAASPAGAVPALLQLEALPADLAVLDRGPTLGAIGEDFFSLTARAVIASDFAVAVRPLDPAGEERRQTFDKNRLLRARIALPKGTRRFSYALTVTAGAKSQTYGPFEAAVPTFGEGFRFVVAANTYIYGHHPEELMDFFAKLQEAKPQLFVHGGVFQNVATHDRFWTDEFFRYSRGALARIPMLAVPGYPDMYSPAAFGQEFYFPTPDGVWGYWTQSFGKVRLVCIEAMSMEEDGGRGLKWLEQTLKDAAEDYVLVFNSQTPNCSGQNAKYYSKSAVDYIAKNVTPLLVRYKVTATIGSYHYVYERAEPPAGEGVTTIMTSKAGGLGWPLRADLREANPASKVAVGYKNHYCLFEVAKDALRMQAIAYETGEVIDTVTFQPRGR